MALKKEQGLNLADIARYLLSKWPWFVLSIVICSAYAYYQYAKAPLVYFRETTIVIKDPANKTSTAGLDRYDYYINKVNVTNEILQFRSKRLMAEVIKRIHSDINYTVKVGLRNIEISNDSPLQATFDSVMPGRYISFKVALLPDSLVRLSHFHGIETGEPEVTLPLSQPLRIGSETLLLTPTDHYTPSWIGREITVTKLPIHAVVDKNLANLGIRQTEIDGSILTISFKDDSPLRADDVLNTLVAVYNENAINEKNRVAITTAEFIAQRLKIIESELGNIESKIETFKQTNNILDIGSVGSQYMGQSQQYDAIVTELATQIKLAEYIKDYLQDPSKTRELIPLNTGISNGGIETQIAQYNALKIKRDKLLDDSSEANPVVLELNKSLHAMRQNIIRAIDNMIVSLNVKRNDALSRQSITQDRVSSIPTKEREMLSIERQQKIKESLYLFLLNRREENALAQSMADNNATVIDDATGSWQPISPKRNKILGMGLLAGIAIPGVIFIVLLFFDTRINSRKDIEGVISVPFIGEIPKEDAQSMRRATTNGSDGPNANHSLTAEAMRVFRTNINFMLRDIEGGKVVTFTSFYSGAGKTFISRNIAARLADAGLKVVILDLDIRKATLSEHYDKHALGVTNYIADKTCTPNDIIIEDKNTPGLHAIKAGHAVPNPSEMLMDKRLDELITYLRQHYDYIIADNVPYGIIADASITNRITDLTVFVVRAGKVDKRMLPDIEAIYTEGKLKNMTVLLNGVNIKQHRYGYEYGYGYGHKHGYGYGYGSRK